MLMFLLPAPYYRFTDEAARERKKLDSEVVETKEMKTKRLEKAVREETIKEQVQVRFLGALRGKHRFVHRTFSRALCGKDGFGHKVALPLLHMKSLRAPLPDLFL